MGVVSVPEEAMELLKKHAIEHELGMSASFGEQFGIIIFGDRTHSIEHIALICSHYLIEGVLSGMWNKSNEVASSPVVVPEPSRTQ